MTDITDLAHQRGGEGQVLSVTKQINVRGEEEPVDVDIIPATSGQRREWQQKLDDWDDELAAEQEAELFEEFTNYKPADFNGAKTWDDVRPKIADALANAIFAEIFDTEEDDFSEALDNAMGEVVESAGNLEQATD